MREGHPVRPEEKIGPDLSPPGNRAYNVVRTMKKIRDRAKNFSLRALAGPGRAEEQDAAILHAAGRGFNLISKMSANGTVIWPLGVSKIASAAPTCAMC